jgi:O-antigen/teichoic acid export membrane protein
LDELGLLKKGTGGLRHVWQNRRDYVINGLSDSTIIGLGFISSILIARGLGPEVRGQLTAALLWPTLAGALATLGLPHAITYAAGARWASAQRLARFGMLFSLWVGLPMAVAYFAVAPLLLKEAFPVLPGSLRLFACFIPLSLWAGLWMALYQGKGDFATWNIAKLIRSAGYTLWIGAALLFGIASVPIVLWSQVVLVVLTLTLLVIRLPRLHADDAGDVLPKAKLFRYGMAIYASGIFYMLNQQLDQLLLSLWVPAQDLGQYASAASLSGILLLVPSTMGPVAFSRLARSGADGGRRHALKAIALCGAFLFPATLLITLVAPWLVRLVYGAAFAPAGQVLRVLAPAAALLGLGNLFSDVLRGSGKPLVPTFAMAAGLLVTIPGLIIALPRWGIWGAAWISLIAYGLVLAVQAGNFILMPCESKLRR